jgi:iron complex outermembrane receptor protein
MMPKVQPMYWVNTPDMVSSTQSSVQIQRGVGTSANGSSAFGGQISLLTHASSK